MTNALKTLAVLALLSYGIISRAQIQTVQRPQLTANAMSLQRYADIPVSLYTGTPDINIPLDTIDNFRLRLPMTLSYHCGGVKVDEHPGWTGLGWTLNVGGVITREVRDEMDEYADGTKIGSYDRGFMYSHGYIENFSKAWTDPLNFDQKSFNDMYGNLPYTLLFDTEPDKFTFNFCGFSGFFMMGTDGAWHVCCDKPIKVKEVKTGDTPQPGNVKLYNSVKIITSITLTDDNGIDYTFGGDAIDMSIEFADQANSIWIPTAWHLAKIACPDGTETVFTYDRGPYTAALSYAEQFGSLQAGDQIFILQSAPYQGKLLSPVYLNGISGDTFNVQFFRSDSHELSYSYQDYLDVVRSKDGSNLRYLYEDGISDMNKAFEQIRWQKLDSVIVSSTSGDRLRKFCLGYNDRPTERLALQMVHVYGALDIVDQCYGFAYSNLPAMPGYMSVQKDSWGFYNATDQKQTDMETSHFANPLTMVYGSLSEIVWPTGGRTVFEFEPHTYSRQRQLSHWDKTEALGRNYVAGGLRIKRMTDFPVGSDGVPHAKSYRYVHNYTGQVTDTASSGILEGTPLYCYTSGNGNNVTVGAYSSESLLPTSNTLGYAVCYPEVSEVSSSGGWTTSVFEGLADSNVADAPPTLYCFDGFEYIPYSSRAHYRGRLSERTVFNSAGHLQRKMTMRYSFVPNGEEYVKGLYMYIKKYTNGQDMNTYGYSFYKTFTGRYLLSDCTTCEYGDNGNMASRITQVCEHNSIGQLKYTHTLFADMGNMRNIDKSYTYAWESRQDMKSANMLAYLAHMEERTNSKPEYMCDTEYRISTSGMPYIYSKAEAQGTQKPKTTYHCFATDDMGYPIFFTDNMRTPCVQLWSGDRSGPIAIIEGATVGEVGAAISGNPMMVSEHSLTVGGKLERMRTLLPNAMVTGYTYIPHVGMSGMTDPSGLTEKYEHDSMGRLSAVCDNRGRRVVSGLYSTISSTADSAAYANAMRSYTEKYININGPTNLHPDSVYTYWTDTRNIPYTCQWGIEGDTAAVEVVVENGRFIKLMGRAANKPRTAYICLVMRDNDGNILCSKRKFIDVTRPLIAVTVDKVRTEGSEILLNITVNRTDNKVVDMANVFANGRLVKTIVRDPNDWYNAAHNGIMDHVSIPKYTESGFYQITVGVNTTIMADMTFEFNIEDLNSD